MYRQRIAPRTALVPLIALRCSVAESHSAQGPIPRNEQVRSSILLSGSNLSHIAVALG
jgi:hypothetical protein